ncbi:MAG: FecR domain-containing protein [Sphingopyxis sp.]|uniref:FecR family protein n=1 Tax=Sphingopyxis sp. TaxID=1908224 RepID=UPI002AB90BAA|nr:FecR domain-containing protein [Sphingopyxis sp.]MDZ3833385.1 FecR domain-containing protein [Sphingopyxis sp.]
MTSGGGDRIPHAMEEEAAEWCWRIADRSLSEDEQKAFDAWVRADTRHQHLFDDMVAVWKGTDTIAEMPGFLSLRAKALTTMENARARNDPEPVAHGGRWHAGAWATAAALILVVGGVWSVSGGPDVYDTGIGERRVVRLDDGSRISLDASSQVSVAYSGDRRSLILDRGRAKFEVAKDPLRPFTVTAGKRAVVATGTAFSVELLHDEMRVLLYEGAVAVIPQPSSRAIASPEAAGTPGRQLTPGQELVADLSSGATKVVHAEVGRSLSWEGGRLDFVDEPLESAIERINRYADTPIALGDAAAGDHLVNGVFDAGDPGSFVKGVTSLFPLAARRANGKIVLVSTDSSFPQK